MLCCGKRTIVTDSRSQVKGRVRRRRKCNICKKRYTTFEVSVPEWLDYYYFNKLLEMVEDYGAVTLIRRMEEFNTLIDKLLHPEKPEPRKTPGPKPGTLVGAAGKRGTHNVQRS